MHETPEHQNLPRPEPGNLDRLQPERQRRPEAAAPGDKPETPANHPPISEANLTVQEREEKEKAWQEVTAALQDLHALLKGQEMPNRSRITAAIDQTALSHLTPIFKRQLAFAIDLHQLQNQNQEVFVQRGLQILDFWIYLQGLKRGANRQIEEIRGGLRTE